MEKQINFIKEIEDVKKRLPRRCAFITISEMLGGKYTSETIRHMFAQRRTMSPLVLEAARKLIDFIQPETKTIEDETDK